MTEDNTEIEFDPRLEQARGELAPCISALVDAIRISDAIEGAVAALAEKTAEPNEETAELIEQANGLTESTGVLVRAELAGLRVVLKKNGFAGDELRNTVKIIFTEARLYYQEEKVERAESAIESRAR